MINKSTIPGHWEIKSLKDVCRKISLNKIKIKQKDYLTQGSFPVVDQGSELIGGYCDETEFIVPEEPPYIIFGDHTKVKKYINFKFIAGADGVKVLKSNSKIDPKFLYYVLHIIKIPDKGYARHFQFLEKENFPLPPLNEQQQIVSKIEELFSELDKGKQQLETVKQQLKTYRHSLLNTIVRDKNSQPIGSAIAKLDQGWSPKCLNEPSNNEDEWAVIKTSAVQHGTFIAFQNKILPKELKPRIQHELKAGDILITRAGPRIRVGVCCMVKKIRPKLINCDKVYRIRVNERILSSAYLELVLNTPYYQHEIEKMKTGISDSGVNLTQTQFLKIQISIPTLKEQQNIVSEIETRLLVCDKMEETIEYSLRQVESLRQSILKQAFEGKLV